MSADQQAFTRGERVTWSYTQPGGYNYVEPVAAIVDGVTPKRVRIRIAQKRAGQWVHVFRTVLPEKLRPRTSVVPVLDQ